MLVDHAPRGRLVGRRQRAHGLDHVVIDQRLELRRLVLHQKCVDEEKELRLALVEVAHRLHHEADVALLLAHDGGGGMLTRAGEVGAILRTVDLDVALRAAADSADLFTQRGTIPFCGPNSTKGAEHGGFIV